MNHRAARVRGGVDAYPHQIAGNVAAQALEARIVIERRAIARTRQIDAEVRAQTRAGAGPQRNNPIRHEQGFIDIVGDQDDRLAGLDGQARDLVLQFGAGQRIEGAERLIEQQDVGAGGQGARYADALAHAAG